MNRVLDDLLLRGDIAGYGEGDDEIIIFVVDDGKINLTKIVKRLEKKLGKRVRIITLSEYPSIG